ncbi:RAM signaling network component [Ascosphaera acerosa]|nr:RAM signaling network component [Ascosphaera acerosa]
MTKRKAYDIARNEFYAARLKEELERSVAHEEALACGARFGPGMLAVGQQLESAAYDRWKAWAEQELMVQEARLAAFAGDTTAGLGDGDADGDAAAKALETEDQLAMGAVEGPPAPQRKKPTLSSMMTA